MRIAFHAPMKPVDDPTPSGDLRVARLLIEALEQGGATVDVPSRFRSYDRGDRQRQSRLEALGHRLAGRLVARYRSGREPRPDLWFTYHLYHKAPDHLGPVVAAALAIPYVVAEASFAPKQAGGQWDIGFRAAERAIRAADRIYCLNPVDAACLSGLVEHPSVLLPLPPFIDTADFRRPAEEQRAARTAIAAEFGFDPDSPLVLTVAMMREDQKLSSYAVLAQALEGLGARNWNLLVVGSGPAGPQVRALFSGFGDRVGFAGRREGADLISAYAAADIFAWPAVKEAFGIAFVEASAAGLAVAAGRSAGIDHIVENGRTGLVVDAGDAGAMSGALKKLLDDPALARRFGELAAARTLAVNDIGAASRMLTADLEALISRHIIVGPA